MFIEYRTIESLPIFITWLRIGSGTKFLSELNKSEVFFWLSRKLTERYGDIYLFYIFSITIALFYNKRTIVSRSNNAWFMQKLSKNPEIMWRKLCQHLSAKSHGIWQCFIDWLIFIYLWNIMLHCLAILHLQAIINRNYNLRKHSPRGVLWKTFFKNLWKLTGKHLSWSMFIIKTAGWRPVTFMAQFSLQYSFLRSGMALGPEISICMHKWLWLSFHGLRYHN